MESAQVVELCRMLLKEAMLLSAPLLICGCMVSVSTSLLQTLTGVQEQTLSTIPRLIAVFGLAILILPWSLHRAVTFTNVLWQDMHRFLG